MFDDETKDHVPDDGEAYVFQVGDVVDNRYVVRAQLGKGGMGAVLLVEDRNSREALALKYCQLGQNPKRFTREVRIMEGIDSPHVIPILGSNLDHVPPYFVMPLAERSLESDLESLVGDEAMALEVFRQICVGVRDLHDRNVFHRDLKPANILRLADGRIVVCDLGLARPANRDTTILTRTIGFLGTEGYLAPEQRQPDGSKNSDARTDVYQLGKVLYQIISGRHPRLVDYAKLPGGLAHIIRKATAEDPGDRYQSVERLEVALNAYRSSKDPLKNPREVLEHLVSRLEREHPDAIPPPGDLANVLETIGHGGWLEHSIVIDCFHRLPVDWLRTIASDHEPLLHPALASYCAAILEKVEGYPWAFADDVSARMIAVVETTPVARSKILALRSLMTAADKLGRFAAQRAFCGCLEAIKTIEMALPVAEMIGDHARPELESFQGYNIELYHPAIRDALNALRVSARGSEDGPPPGP